MVFSKYTWFVLLAFLPMVIASVWSVYRAISIIQEFEIRIEKARNHPEYKKFLRKAKVIGWGSLLYFILMVSIAIMQS